MKRNFIFVFAALCGALVAPFTASGQTYYDFALEELLGSSTNSHVLSKQFHLQSLTSKPIVSEGQYTHFCK